MEIKQVALGLMQGKKYQLPGWDRFYIFRVEDAIYIKSIHTEPLLYSLHISEITSNKWIEFKEKI
jgi:hypothetical protein